MLFVIIAAVDNVALLDARHLEELGDFRRRILQIVVHRYDEFTAARPQTFQHGIMFAKVARKAQERDGHFAVFHQLQRIHQI